MRMQNVRQAPFKFQPFSGRQRRILTWWTASSPYRNARGIIADGAIRSGKTVAMSLSYVMWSMATFSGQNFIIAGKTVGAVRRNILPPLKSMLLSRGYLVEDFRADNLLLIRRGEVENYFYIFGGKDERSQDLIAGLTAAGAYFDEVALMPQSFVNQATGRCSVEGAKLWFNCNPSGPLHWLKRDWIDRSQELGILYLHFTMADNASLSEDTRERYRAMYAGVFYLRYIRGIWAVAEGLIYTSFSDVNLYDDESRPAALYSTSVRTIAVDYGTTNPCVFLDIRDDGHDVWVDNEWRWDSRSEEAMRSGAPNMTDAQYADALLEFMGPAAEDQCPVIVDPSAKSFIVELQQRGVYVKEGVNDVLDGIRDTASLFYRGLLHIHKDCTGLIQELRSYVWDEKAAQRGEEKPVKMQDHGPDALRYFVNTCLPDWRKGAA